MPSSPTHYTLLFTCGLSLPIPCHPSSPDRAQTLPIDKPCPQCAPHPHLIPVIFDQEHFDVLRAGRLLARGASCSKAREISPSGSTGAFLVGGKSDDAGSLRGAQRNGRTTSKMSRGFGKVRRVVRGKRGLNGWMEEERQVDGEEEDERETERREKEVEKKREIAEKLDEVERELALEKAKTIERSLRALV